MGPRPLPKGSTGPAEREREREHAWLWTPGRPDELAPDASQGALDGLQDALVAAVRAGLLDWREVDSFLLTLERRASWLELAA